jgi:hypothetical protein
MSRIMPHSDRRAMPRAWFAVRSVPTAGKLNNSIGASRNSETPFASDALSEGRI